MQLRELAELSGGLHRRTDALWRHAVGLVDDDEHRHTGSECGLGAGPVAPTDRLGAIDHEQNDVDVRERLVDALGHPSRQSITRDLDTGQVREDQLPVAAVGDTGDATPRRLGPTRRDRDVLADDRVDQRALADIRPSGQADKCATELHPRRVRDTAGCRQRLRPCSTLIAGSR